MASGDSTAAVITTLEKPVRSTTAILTTLEKPRTSTTAVSTTLETFVPRKATNYRAVHLGALSIDNHTLTQVEITDAITAIVSNIPSATHIVVGTYLDYASQISLWAQAIHNAGKKFVLRSAGFNDWQGTNGVAQYTGTDFAAHSISQYVSFVNANYSIFQAGDIFEPFPDEPEDNSCWSTISGSGSWADILYEGGGRSWVERLFDWDTAQYETDFNAFVVDAVSQVGAAFTTNGVTGVTTNVGYFTPSVARDVLTSATASVLQAVGTNDYPENGLTTVNAQSQALSDEVTGLINPAQSASTPWHITFGPSIYSQLDQETQAATLSAELRTILNTLTHPLDGITIWLFGDYTNSPTSRLFDWDESSLTDMLNERNGRSLVENLLSLGGSQWVARTNATTLQELFTVITPSTIGILTTLEVPGTKSTAGILTTLERQQIKSTVALSATLEKPSQSTVGLFTNLEPNLLSATAILTTLDKPVFNTTAVLTTLERQAVASTVGILTTLDKPARSTTALLTNLEKPTAETIAVIATLERGVVSTAAILTTLESPAQDSTIAISTQLEKPVGSTVAVSTSLEKVTQGTIALVTTLERVSGSTVPILAMLERGAEQSTLGVLTTLEKTSFGTTAVITNLEDAQAKTVAIFTDLQRPSTRRTIPIVMRFRDTVTSERL